MLTRSDIVVDGDGVPIEAIVFRPEVSSAAIVVLHGWGGSAESMVEPTAEMAGLGYLAIAVSMRGWGRSGGRDDCGLEQPDDIAAVLAWLMSAYPDCTSAIGLLGISQGGQVALLCAERCSMVSAVAAWAPVTDVALWRETTEYPGIPQYIDVVCADGELARRSPVSFVGDLNVPVLLVHGDADTRVPTAQSRLLHDAIIERGGASRLELLDGVAHNRGSVGNRRAFDITADFFAEHLTTTERGHRRSMRLA